MRFTKQDAAHLVAEHDRRKDAAADGHKAAIAADQERMQGQDTSEQLMAFRVGYTEGWLDAVKAIQRMRA